MRAIVDPPGAPSQSFVSSHPLSCFSYKCKMVHRNRTNERILRTRVFFYAPFATTTSHKWSVWSFRGWCAYLLSWSACIMIKTFPSCANYFRGNSKTVYISSKCLEVAAVDEVSTVYWPFPMAFPISSHQEHAQKYIHFHSLEPVRNVL